LKKLCDLSPDQVGKTNVIAVISSITIPSKSGGSQHMVRMELVDKSFDTIITCILFGDEDFLPNSSNIPHPSIIRLRRLKVEYFQGRPQVLNRPGFSWAIYRTEAGNFDPVDRSHPNTALSIEDSELGIILELQQWVTSQQFRNTTFSKNPTNILSEPRQSDSHVIDQNAHIPPAAKKTKFNKFMNGITPFSATQNDLYYNSIAMVIGGCHMEDEKCSILRCFDGSKVPLPVLRVNNQFIKGNSTLAEMDALTEYYVDVQIYESHREAAATFQPGDIVEFTNLHMYTPQGLKLPEVILHNGDAFRRGLVKLAEDDSRATPLVERISGITVIEEEPELPPLPDDETSRSLQTSVTECLYEELEVQSLAFIKDNISTTLQGTDNYKKYKSRIVIDSVESGDGTECYQDCVRPYCALCGVFGEEGATQCPNDNYQMVDKFFFILNVRDASSTARIICSGEAAQEFLDTEHVRPSLVAKVAKTINRWCDVHVKGCVIQDEVALFITSSIIKSEPAFVAQY